MIAWTQLISLLGRQHELQPIIAIQGSSGYQL